MSSNDEHAHNEVMTTNHTDEEDSAMEENINITPEVEEVEGGMETDAPETEEVQSEGSPEVDAAAEAVAESPAKKPRRSTKKVAEKAPIDDSNPDETIKGVDTVDTADSEETSPAKPALSATERAQQNAARRRERDRKRRQSAMLDAEGNPILDGDGTFDATFAEISQARSTRKILSGTIDEIKRPRDGQEGWVEVVFKGFRILIPFSQMDVELSRREEEDQEMFEGRHHAAIAYMLGSRIDFVIKAVDADGGFAVASRAEACKAKRDNILNGTDRDGNYNVYVGRAVQAMVLSVHTEVAYIDVFGFRTILRKRDIRSEYTDDVTEFIENGQALKVFVTDLERDPQTGDVTRLFVSMRNDDAERRELERAAAALNEGDTCRGRVTSRTKKAIYIQLNNGLRAFVFIANGLMGRAIPAVGESVSVRVLRKIESRVNSNPVIQGRIVRNINHIAR